MNALKRILGANSDIAMVLLVVGVLVVLFAPIPSGVLDFLILANFSFALLILLLTFYMAKPVEFSTFPSLLLVATLFRLSLNVAATRLILSEADAGHVIGAIGAYVVGGNYVIGLIVFLILVVVQYVVVTSGAQRVSEVAARFTLDSMPGQQMSIDADLNMGFIDQKEAQLRRKNVSKEAGFYGAMDGASKFVKGDAIAGIIIMLINIVGGLVIGVMQLGMPWADALRTYTLLTIGDGIVTQVPALVISVATGLIVTRSASDATLSTEVLRQITAFNKTLVLVVAALFGLMFLPGIPVLPVLTLAAFFAVLALVKYRSSKKGGADDGEAEPDGAAAKDEDAYSSLAIEPIEVHLGANLVPQPGAAVRRGRPVGGDGAHCRFPQAIRGRIRPGVAQRALP
jgi:flagellar biosynthesis protein FlhA